MLQEKCICDVGSFVVFDMIWDEATTDRENP